MSCRSCSSPVCRRGRVTVSTVVTFHICISLNFAQTNIKNPMPVSRWRAVVERISRGTAAVTVGYCWGDTSWRVRRQFGGGSEVPGRGRTRSADTREKPGSEMFFSFFFLSVNWTYRAREKPDLLGMGSLSRPCAVLIFLLNYKHLCVNKQTVRAKVGHSITRIEINILCSSLMHCFPKTQF